MPKLEPITNADLQVVLVDALRAMERCPGIDITDQETGDTFRDLIRAAISKAQGHSQ